MKNALLFFLFLSFSLSYAQYGIGTTEPKTTLQIDGDALDDTKADGLIIPKLKLSQLEAKMTTSAYGPDQDGAMVYIIDVTPSTLSETAGIVSKGLYIFNHDGTTGSWKATGENKLWSTRGNAGTDETTDFIGTTDNVALNFRVNDTKAGRIGAIDGSVFLGVLAGATDDLSNNKNTFIGGFSGTNTSTGFENVGVGFSSLSDNTTGTANIAVGSSALNANETGNYNSAVGFTSLQSNTSGEYNSAYGFWSQIDNESGNRNTAFGARTLTENIGGSNNVAVGYAALQRNTTNDNTAVGYEALKNNTTGNENTATGYQTLHFNQTGFRNTAVGYEALYQNTGSNNTALGGSTLKSNTSGSFNTAIGYGSLLENTSGSFNTSNGFAMSSNTTGESNTAIGFTALTFNQTGSNNVALGYEALFNNTASDNTAIGYQSLKENTSGSFNTALGHTALFFGNYSNSTAIGFNAQLGSDNTVRLGNTAVGSIGGYANWTNVSDGRFKQNVKENVVGLEFIKKLRPVTYKLDMDALARFNKTPDSLRLRDAEQLKAAELQTGFIAQEVEQAAQEVGYDFHGVDKPKNENSHYGLRYAEFVVPLVKAVQEQQEEIVQQNEKIEFQDKKTEQLRMKLEEQSLEINELKTLIETQQNQIKELMDKFAEE